MTDGSTHPPIAHAGVSAYRSAIVDESVDPFTNLCIIYGCAYEKEKICAGGGQKHGATYNRARIDTIRRIRTMTPIDIKTPGWLPISLYMEAIHS